MRRREFIVGLGSTAAAWPMVGRAQQGERVRQVSWFGTENSEQQAGLSALIQELQRLGWTIGRNLNIERNGRTSGDTALRAAAAELVARNPDVMVANGTPRTEALKQLTRAAGRANTQDRRAPGTCRE
jgi:putative ABC transport system substrate-binding protein